MAVTMDMNDDEAGFVLALGLAVDGNMVVDSGEAEEVALAPVVVTVVRVDARDVSSGSVVMGASRVDGNDVGSGSVMPVVVAGVRVEANNVVDVPVLAIGLFDEDILVESAVTAGVLGDAKDVESCPVVTISVRVDPTDVFFASDVIMAVTMDMNDDEAGFVLALGLAVDGNVVVGSVDAEEVALASVVVTVVRVDTRDVRPGSVLIAGLNEDVKDVTNASVVPCTGRGKSNGHLRRFC